MEISRTLYVASSSEWRDWLKKNHATEKEIWLVYFRKSSGKKRIPYNDAVDEALCFGWIDSTVKKIDEKSFAQRFTPRNPKSHVSEMNKERIRKLLKENKMTESGLNAVKNFFHPVKDRKEKFAVATDILREIKKNSKAWKNFQKFPLGYKRVRIGYIESQRKHSAEAFQKSLKNFIKKTEQNKKFGMLQ
ncbi:MAG: YdeI/OmpD-associated family protein [archaeon]